MLGVGLDGLGDRFAVLVDLVRQVVDHDVVVLAEHRREQARVDAREDLGGLLGPARAAVLEVAGRTEEAAEILAGIDASLLAAVLGEDDDVVVYDLTEEADEDGDAVAEPLDAEAAQAPDDAASADETTESQDEEPGAGHDDSESAFAPSDEAGR